MRPLLPLLLCLLVSCASVVAESDADPEVDFGAFRTYVLAEAPADAPGLGWYSELRGAELERGLAAAVEERGLRPASAEEADLLLSFQLHGHPRSEVRATGSGWVLSGAYAGPGCSPWAHPGSWYGAGWYGPVGYGPTWITTDVYATPYTVGTLALEARLPAARPGDAPKLVWRGWASARFNGGDVVETCEELVKAVARELPKMGAGDPGHSSTGGSR